MKFNAVLFDCDGILVDSEPIALGVLRDMLEEKGWKLTKQECIKLFSGKSVPDERKRIKQETGFEITDQWIAKFKEKRNDALLKYVQPIEGVAETLKFISARYSNKIACCSGADMNKIRLQLKKTNLLQHFGANIFSGLELPRSKPFPDVYITAANALGVPPNTCAVIEDSITGVMAGHAAGATVFAYCPVEGGHATETDLIAAGAHITFNSMSQLISIIENIERQ